jgi:hypothetical protein
MMESMQQNMNEQMKKFADMQAKSLEPMRVFSALAAEAGEQLMRQNHAVMGDFVEYAVKLLLRKLPTLQRLANFWAHAHPSTQKWLVRLVRRRKKQ